MGRVLVVGSVNADLVYRVSHLPSEGETLLASSFEVLNGGKGANQAVAAARMGAEVAFCGAFGNDPFALSLRANLLREGINLDPSIEVQGPSGNAAIFVDDAGRNQIVVASGANASVNPSQVLQAIESFRPEVVLAQLEIPLEAVLACTHGPKFILNPAPWRELPSELLERCFALIPNETEFQGLTEANPEAEDELESGTRDLLEAGVENVVVTLGARGAVWRDATGLTVVPALKVQPVDTTAAGDTYCGALSAFLTEGLKWSEALHLAGIAASLSTTRPGAQASCPTRDEVLFHKIQIS